MNTRTKIITSIMSLILVAVAATFAVGNMFAATRQNIDASFTVTYVAVDVNAEVSATYYKSEGDPVNLMNGSSTILALNRNAETGSLTTANFTLSPKLSWVVFEYKIENKSPSVGIRVVLEDTSITDNVDVKYGFTTTRVTSSVSAKKAAATTAKSALTAQTVNAGGTLYCYIAISIVVMNANASYKSFPQDYPTNGLKWTLTSLSAS